MINVPGKVRLRRTVGNEPPPNIQFGEPAYSDGNQRLYIGRSNGTVTEFGSIESTEITKERGSFQLAPTFSGESNSADYIKYPKLGLMFISIRISSTVPVPNASTVISDIGVITQFTMWTPAVNFRGGGSPEYVPIVLYAQGSSVKLNHLFDPNGITSSLGDCLATLVIDF